MSRFKEPPLGFVCPYKDHCPYLEGLSTHWIFSEYQRSHIQEHEHWRTREQMAEEINSLLATVSEQAEQIDRLQAENKRLHQRNFKPRRRSDSSSSTTETKENRKPPSKKKKRGAPQGHPPWTRKVPDHIDRTVKIDPPCSCPHCQEQTDLSQTDTTSFVQEDIVLRPQTLVTTYIHATAYCPKCRRQVIRELDGELPFAPIGPNAKAAALYLRHELKLPYRKIQQAISTLFGLDFVAASSLGFEKRARKNADPLYEELILKMRTGDIVHADETHWREDGKNHFVWYAGNNDVAVFHIDAHRSSEAAKVLLGDRIEGVLVTDAYAAYNAISVLARQSCLAHLLRKAQEVGQELDAMKHPDTASVRFCSALAKLFKMACQKTIPSGRKARTQLKDRFLRALDLICDKVVNFPKAETLRKRLVPGAREYDEVFTFIAVNGPPTNNHAERTLRPLVIFRKVCMGTRSAEGSKNISVFSSVTETAKIQGSPIIDVFLALLTETTAKAHDVIFNDSS